jgi:hypothetical protein
MDDLTMTQLREMGKENLAKTKVINYERIANPKTHAIKQKPKTFRSFED